MKSTIVGIVVLDEETLVSWCAGKGVSGKYEDLLGDGKVNKLVLDDLCAVGKERGLKPFELVRTDERIS